MSSLSTKMIRWVGLGKVKKTIQEVVFLLCWYLVISSFYLIVSSFVFFWIFDYFVFFSLSSTPDPSLSGKHTSFLRSVNTLQAWWWWWWWWWWLWWWLWWLVIMTITMMTMIIVDNFVVIYMLLWEKGCETECADFFGRQFLALGQLRATRKMVMKP